MTSFSLASSQAKATEKRIRGRINTGERQFTLVKIAPGRDSMEKQPNHARLQAQRKKKGLTLQQLAAAAGVSIGEVYALEIGGYVERSAQERILPLLREGEDDLEKTLPLSRIEKPSMER